MCSSRLDSSHARPGLGLGQGLGLGLGLGLASLGKLGSRLTHRPQQPPQRAAPLKASKGRERAGISEKKSVSEKKPSGLRMRFAIPMTPH